MQKSNQNTEVAKTLESVTLLKDENFRVYSEIDILFLMRKIMQTNSLVTLSFNDGNNSFLTSILAVNSDQKKIIIDYGPNEKISQQALQSKKLIFVTTQNKVKIEFFCDHMDETDFQGKNAFLINIPEYLLRIQRRDNFRISTPIAKPLKCIIPVPVEDKSITTEITLLDISCGGIGAMDQNSNINLEPGIIYKDCQIPLPEIGIVSATIIVKNAYPMKLQSGASYYRIGCQFIDLPAKTEAMIQRYIVKQEQIIKTKDS